MTVIIKIFYCCWAIGLIWFCPSALLGQVNQGDLIIKLGVKSVKEIFHCKEKEPKVMDYKYYNPNGTLKEHYSIIKGVVHKYKYTGGLLTKKESFYGTLDNKALQLFQHQKYRYDDKQRLLQESKWKHSSNGDSLLQTSTFYTYDHKDSLVKRIHISDGNKRKTIVNRQFYPTGELYKESYKSFYHKKQTSIVEHIYDKCGNHIYRKIDSKEWKPHYTGNDIRRYNCLTIDTLKLNNQSIIYTVSDSNEKVIYHYDSLEKLIEKSKYSFESDGELDDMEESFFNQKEQLIQLNSISSFIAHGSARPIYYELEYKYYLNGLLSEVKAKSCENIYGENIENNYTYEYQIEYY